LSSLSLTSRGDKERSIDCNGCARIISVVRCRESRSLQKSALTSPRVISRNFDQATKNGDSIHLNFSMQFAQQLRSRVINGEITCSIRVWQGARVKAGGRYRLGEGYVVVDRIMQMDFESITPVLARKSGFASVPELLRTAVHGPGRNVYLVEFHYE
jgi:hypothetical protein